MKCDFCGKPGAQDPGSGNFQCEECVNLPRYEKSVVALVTRTRHTVRLGYNMTAEQVKEIFTKIPDDAVLTMFTEDNDDGDDYVELYFDIETDSN